MSIDPPPKQVKEGGREAKKAMLIQPHQQQKRLNDIILNVHAPSLYSLSMAKIKNLLANLKVKIHIFCGLYYQRVTIVIYYRSDSSLCYNMLRL